MIRNAVLHLLNDQPMLVDLFEAPSSGDLGLRCTNLRMMNGKRPAFIDDQTAVFFFPYIHIRFIEIPARALAGVDGLADLETVALATAPARHAEPEVELDIDEDFLRKVREV
jgi:hypothetical protein